MIEVKCIGKERTKAGTISSYTLVDKSGKVEVFSADKVKDMIRKGTIKVANLTLTKDNRLLAKGDAKGVNTASDVTQKTNNTPDAELESIGIEYIKQMLNKAQPKVTLSPDAMRLCSKKLTAQFLSLLNEEFKIATNDVFQYGRPAEVSLNRVVKITRGPACNKYVLTDTYKGVGIYERMTPRGYFAMQDWYVTDNQKLEALILPAQGVCKEELLDMIDRYLITGKFE